jgi:quinoprotein glucose dehydrogenase
VEWRQWNGDPEGTRYSSVDQINTSNVQQLKPAWSAPLGDCRRCVKKGWRVEVTPLMANGTIFLSTPDGRVIALAAESGRQLWSFDTKLDTHSSYVEGFVSRGLALWDGSDAKTDASCSRRIFVATLDARLLALDASTGAPCLGFGNSGTVDLAGDVALDQGRADPGYYGVTSPPTVIGNLIVVGSAINKTQRRGAESGVVRAFHAQSGEVVWKFDPIPRDSIRVRTQAWDPQAALVTGGANVWSSITADTARGLIFLPTASASPDYYGGYRPGRNELANSVIALRASTGEVIWSFQFVHHDLWDYDVAAAPLLARLSVGPDTIPAVVVGTKSGMVYVLDRESGAAILPIEERAVPSSDVPGEQSWPTQPISTGLPALHEARLSQDMIFGITPKEYRLCSEQLNSLRNNGTFTPPSLNGSVEWPGVWGGINWDGMAWDARHQLLVVSIKRLATIVQLYDRRAIHPVLDDVPGLEVLQQRGTPFVAIRRPFVAPSGVPCTAPPWGALVGLDLRTKTVRWSRPLGTIPSLRRIPYSSQWGSITFGAPLITAGGLIFIGASQDDHFRAVDVETGMTLWEYELPAGGQAGAMTYLYRGRQYILIAAGGRDGIGTPGHSLVAFALPRVRRY